MCLKGREVCCLVFQLQKPCYNIRKFKFYIVLPRNVRGFVEELGQSLVNVFYVKISEA